MVNFHLDDLLVKWRNFSVYNTYVSCLPSIIQNKHIFSFNLVIHFGIYIYLHKIYILRTIYCKIPVLIGKITKTKPTDKKIK